MRDHHISSNVNSNPQTVGTRPVMDTGISNDFFKNEKFASVCRLVKKFNFVAYWILQAVMGSSPAEGQHMT
jgi:hypothetical protein